METVRIGGRRYTDPDIISLARQTGELICPRFTIRMQARLLLEELSKFSGLPPHPFERLKILASLKGIKIKPMDIESQRREKRDAVLYPVSSGRVILYNPNRPPSRILFTLAHEIIHTLFPNSGGARFRSITNPESREASELERLCDLGAAELVLPLEEFRKLANGDYSLSNTARLMDLFGTSFEATTFRLASAHPGFAVAGLLRHRRRLGEDREVIKVSSQRLLFSMRRRPSQPAAKKYRRQSFYLSERCGTEYNIPWNKSFDLDSVVYQAEKHHVVSAIECLPNSVDKLGRIEAIIAPYQRDDADSDFGDVLFVWEQI
jgi:hypothetical protein